jgi:hypothetical protein
LAESAPEDCDQAGKAAKTIVIAAVSLIPGTTRCMALFINPPLVVQAVLLDCEYATVVPGIAWSIMTGAKLVQQCAIVCTTILAQDFVQLPVFCMVIETCADATTKR